MAVLTVNFGRLEFTGRNSLSEQCFELGERPILGLGQSEPATRRRTNERRELRAPGTRSGNSPPDQTEDVGTRVEEGGLGSPIPSGGGQHPRSDRVTKDTSEVVDESSEHNRLGSKTTGAGLGDNGVTNGSDGGHIDQGLDDEDRSDGPRSALRVCKAQSTDGQEANQHTGKTSHVKSGSSEFDHQEPTDDAYGYAVQGFSCVMPIKRAFWDSQPKMYIEFMT